MSELKLLEISSSELSNYIDELASLRIRVFKEFPYLYEGNLEYEQKYLSRYQKANAFLLVGAFENGKMVGATTCLPLSEEEEEFRQPHLQAGYNTDKIFYFGESILLSQYRGRGIGKAFFDKREAHAKKVISDLEFTCFCAVDRESHPLTPEDYRPLDSFWESRSYEKSSKLFCEYSWKDIDKEEEDKKRLYFWFKKWT